MHPDQHQQPYEVFLVLLREARIQADLTQQELATRIGWTQSFVSKCERGERRIDVIDLITYLDGIGFSSSDFVGTLVNALGGPPALAASTSVTVPQAHRPTLRDSK
ncbi:helix-turn-helix transcriptional regulator [Asticcacaulis sp.]|uniref:helix-turn-helix domain-containing protein n=1 Tax=Asticcacaulis sp. TaxID=1872648 RepID=UPI00261C22FE|nr:helix-turn-helix transcriptional regulator [Asticcacaulis sp.]